MTAQHDHQRESIDLLERILEHVETIDRNVEDLLDQVVAHTYDGGYDPRDHDNEYE